MLPPPWKTVLQRILAFCDEIHHTRRMSGKRAATAAFQVAGIRRLEAASSDIIREVGSYQNGRCLN